MHVKKMVLIFLGIFILLLSGCTKRLLKFDGNSEKEIVFDCGEAKFQIQSLAFRNFYIIQKFHFKGKATLYPDSVKVETHYNKINSKYVKFFIDQKVVDSNEIILSDSTVIGLAIDTEIGLIDTLKIYLNNYIKCDTKGGISDTIMIPGDNESKVTGETFYWLDWLDKK